MARKRARKTSRLDSAAIAAGSALGSIAKKIDTLTSRRAAISTQLKGLVGQAEGALKGLAKGENPFRGRKARKKAAPKKRRTAAKATAKAKKKR